MIPYEQTVADLHVAADLIERDGWTRGAFACPEPGRICHCVQGALAAVISGDMFATPETARDAEGGRWPDTRFDRANQAISRVVGRHPADWNDHVCKTAEEAVATLREAAAQLKVPAW